MADVKSQESPKGLGSIPARISKTFRETKGEIKRVVWPSKKQIVNHTGVVIAVMIVASIFIGGFDLLLSALVNLLLRGS